MQQYQDIKGVTGFKTLRGASGRTYGNTNLLTASQIAEMLADGIVKWTPPDRPIPTDAFLLEQAKIVKGAEIQAGYDYANALPIDYMATTFQADKDSQDLVVSVLSAGAVPDGFYWLDILNNKVTMTYADLQGLSQALLMRGQINFATRLALKTANKVATTVLEVEAVTLPTSWIQPE